MDATEPADVRVFVGWKTPMVRVALYARYWVFNPHLEQGHIDDAIVRVAAQGS